VLTDLRDGSTRVVVDVDLKQFFDKVHQDRLMSKVAERVTDQAVAVRLSAGA